MQAVKVLPKAQITEICRKAPASMHGGYVKLPKNVRKNLGISIILRILVKDDDNNNRGISEYFTSRLNYGGKFLI